ncbi:MAG: sulfotransferase [Novosphingobium sp. 32-60-15]|uniref:tetratricopeptide repeat-containing sulfotransferase family protein n=1 Tax=unclassified Novosphingobium TaxID=2644732 RepID=UPI000BC81C94|nr:MULTISPECIES: tetratricopeptide repeat-containing sulfotransferase family protein [unclassified Novosphingobium]OYX63836.1 MAG: sulfotransferase [Novosphingobium sp. 32-60-15]
MTGSVQPDLRQLMASGDKARTLREAALALENNPKNHEAAFVAAIIFIEAGKLGEALAQIALAVTEEPANVEYLAQQARILITARREAEALAAAKAASQLTSSDPFVLDTIGCVFARLGAHEEALPLFERAVGIAPDVLDFRFNLASTLGFFGKVDDAAEQYEAIIARNPTHGRAHLGLAGLRRKATPALVDKIEAALKAVTDPLDAVRLHYAAAAALEDTGRDGEAFAHLAQGNAEHRARIDYDITRDEGLFEALRHTFAHTLPMISDSVLPDAPIFVVGLPRTGTTLVDRILSSHPQVTSAGELQAMPLAVKQMAKTPSRLVLDEPTIAGLSSLSAQALGELYLARARQNSGAQSMRFVDKFPLNFLYIGWIIEALPNANIVCLRRGAMDSVWSNYKHLFATGSPYYRWSYDLMDTARYVLMFQRIMGFWRQRFPGRIHEISYEQLVADQEVQSRRMLAHCGLAWDPACLDFHRNEAAVATPSAQQVRQPINSRAVGRWRTHEHRLGEVMEFFVANGIPLD